MVDPIGAGLIALSAAIAVSATGIAAALGEQVIGSAAIGVMAEDEGFFGRGLVMTVIPESLVKRISTLKYGGTLPCSGGVMLENEDGTVLRDLTFDSILKNVRDRSLKQLLQILSV